MNETDLENELRSLRPAAPSPELARGIAASLEPRVETHLLQDRRPSWFAWWVERLMWAGAGATAAVVALAMSHQAAPKTANAVAKQDAPPAMAAHASEEPLAWTDEGVRFIGNQIPAHLLRRVTLERRVAEDGTEVQVPREDVIVLPVALR